MEGASSASASLINFAGILSTPAALFRFAFLLVVDEQSERSSEILRGEASLQR